MEGLFIRLRRLSHCLLLTTTNVWEVTGNLDQTHHTDINDIGNMIIYRGPSQIPEDTNNSLVGILEAPSYTTEYIYAVEFKKSNLFVNGDVSINYNLSVGSDASFGNDVDICGNLYAQYPNNSIPVSALNGNVGVDTESDLSLNAKLSVGQMRLLTVVLTYVVISTHNTLIIPFLYQLLTEM